MPDTKNRQMRIYKIRSVPSQLLQRNYKITDQSTTRDRKSNASIRFRRILQDIERKALKMFNNNILPIANTEQSDTLDVKENVSTEDLKAEL